jgi:hypothetical protein
MIGDHLTIFDRDHILVLYKIDTPVLSLSHELKKEKVSSETKNNIIVIVIAICITITITVNIL